MRIQFEIKEGLVNILNQLMNSDFWATEIKEDESGKKTIKIKDLTYNLEAVAEVKDNEIFIKTALSKYTYRIYKVKDECWCEYVGAYRGLLEQRLLPMITPKKIYWNAKCWIAPYWEGSKKLCESMQKII